MTVPARPGLEKGLLTDLPRSLARLELLPVPQLGAAVFDAVQLVREGQIGLAAKRYGVTPDELLLLKIHHDAPELRAAELREHTREFADELARGFRRDRRRTTFAAATHPREDAA